MSAKQDRMASTSLHISDDDLDLVWREARSAYPNECCGVLVGTTSGDDVRVSRAVPTANARGDQTDRFEIPTEEILRAMRLSRKRGEEIVGYYHSHPDRPARPSKRDRRDAWEGVSYLIASVSGGLASGVRSWRLSEEGDFREEPVVPVGSPLLACEEAIR